MLAPLTVAVPILAAGLLVVAGRWIRRAVTETVSLAAAVATAVCAVLLAVGGRTVTWLGGWRPHGHTVGIVFVADPIGAGLAALAAILVTAAIVYGWRYFPDAEIPYQALLLLFLGGMAGFSVTADLFDMFVFFELMGAAAYALTGFRVEEPESVQGSLTFGVTNSLGAYLTLMGVGLLYARTGQLGLAQMGVELASRPVDILVTAGFVLVCCGFLVKAAIVPFHFWLADAHAVAPTPVCVLLSGVMAELGVYGIARVYWVTFSDTLAAPSVRRALLALGVATALLGATMCLAQRHLKRLLAYSTVAHQGLFLVGVAVLSPDGVHGTALYVLGHAGTKGALFLLTGVLLNRYGSVDEVALHGRAGLRTAVAWLFFAGGLALSGLPPFGPGLGKGLAEDAATHAGFAWLSAVFVLVSALTGGAVLRAGLRVFAGIGSPARPQHPSQETSGEHEAPEEPITGTPVVMVGTAAALLVGALAVGLVPPFSAAIGRAAEEFTDRYGFVQQTLYGIRPLPPVEPSGTWWSPAGLLLGFAGTALAVAVALIAVAGVPQRLARSADWLSAPMGLLHRLHSGHIGDYVAWLFAGLAAFALLIGLS